MSDAPTILEQQKPPQSSRMSVAANSAGLPAETNTELAMRRTGMAFQRTRMGADRTLMAVIRTSLSLISFGFTIYQFLGRLQIATNPDAARNFGMALVDLGFAMITLGIVYHLHFMWALRVQRKEMTAEGLIYGKSPFPPSLTLITAVLLWFIALLAASSMIFRAGPFE